VEESPPHSHTVIGRHQLEQPLHFHVRQVLKINKHLRCGGCPWMPKEDKTKCCRRRKASTSACCWESTSLRPNATHQSNPSNPKPNRMMTVRHSPPHELNRFMKAHLLNMHHPPRPPNAARDLHSTIPFIPQGIYPLSCQNDKILQPSNYVSDLYVMQESDDTHATPTTPCFSRHGFPANHTSWGACTISHMLASSIHPTHRPR